ncbi:hypothetical protein BH09DEP1_BH09DEP1_3450 [soil metagenome]
MKNVKKLLILNLILIATNSHAMHDWIRTNLQNLGLTEPKPGPTQELKQIIEREGTFKNVGIRKIQTLIGLQADPNVVSHDGRTALLIAIADNDPLVVRLLAEFVKADINKRYGQGMTPLAIAAGDGKPLLIPILLRFGADINTRDNLGNTPLILATRIPDGKIAIQSAQVLIDAGIDVNAQNNAGDTALHKAINRAILNRSYDLIPLLLENGADSTIVNNAGQTPLAIAQTNQDQKAIELLSPKALKLP